ncbi:MAG: HxlR family transcriptional regulator [Candidatus Fluviicola riflensis]|nr:MAG: transcriptional regulator [Candidatus Fluviicola riflensis]OGS77187.1 MAG: HxlR family transcriptional regulator [Candidatus Fluviicola riflensis]OGS82122.1 MAG: HxlR family transcriptional regulator [Fluviicola sp. RIFCSPHIGHO2_01_FULL_43_53]OGS87816.1 MAG: HxlR family transcriptional regulator [Fluviicola sp. RIFCSPHIGHO2_12_FULL_43_24]
MEKKVVHQPAGCSKHLLAIRDTMELLSGKWKIQIIGTLILTDKVRFMDLMRAVDGIGAKMLSKELQELEINQLITRTVCDTKPITVEYEITEYGKTLKNVISEMEAWGTKHRERLFQSVN